MAPELPCKSFVYLLQIVVIFLLIKFVLKRENSSPSLLLLSIPPSCPSSFLKKIRIKLSSSVSCKNLGMRTTKFITLQVCDDVDHDRCIASGWRVLARKFYPQLLPLSVLLESKLIKEKKWAVQRGLHPVAASLCSLSAC